MTEQKELLEAAISEIDRVLIGNKSSDVNKIYLNNAKRFIKESMVDEVIENQKQPFKVGEYYSFEYSDKQEVFKVMSVYEDRMSVESYKVHFDMFSEFQTYMTGNSTAVTYSKPATAEEIALFKRAEHFHSKGRKLNEFKIGDILREKDVNGIVTEIREYGQVVVQYPGELLQVMYCGYIFGNLTLIMTAEELEAAAMEVEG
ncbi:hypothetical protein [uncultured Enterococcus sp.]|uniref:hypothetical protein n=1 Tax=uncultured Enterococcus sp. TaxID=167972 RepID=UPI002AA8EF9B|nr:hypothetical protein [uncultured Enterococcus sp.]